MCGYPGATFNLDIRLGIPKPVYEYYVTLLPQADVRHIIHLDEGRSLSIAPSSMTKTFPGQQPTQAASMTSLKSFSETVRGPLGWLVHARWGDKGSNANVGFWVRHQDEYDWMRAVLTVESLKGLLAKEYHDNRIVHIR
jgi:hypothetical protein